MSFELDGAKRRPIELSDEIKERLYRGIEDPAFGEVIKENYLTYMNVMTGGRYNLTDYINAIRYVSCRLMGYTIRDSYVITFPDRAKKVYAQGEKSKAGPESYLSGFSSMYNRTKLVNQILAQSLVPTFVLNAPLHQEALNNLVEMIRNPAVKGMTRVKACEVLLNYTKQPDTVRVEASLDVSGVDTVSALKDAVTRLASTLKSQIENGSRELKEVAETNFVTGLDDDQPRQLPPATLVSQAG